MFPGTYYDFGDNVRDLGGDVMSDDGKKFLFGTDPSACEVAQWFADLRVKYKAAPEPGRHGTRSSIFPTGRIASTATGAVSVKSIAQQIGDKFKWGAVLGPTGKDGLRGYDSFSLYWKSTRRARRRRRPTTCSCSSPRRRRRPTRCAPRGRSPRGSPSGATRRPTARATSSSGWPTGSATPGTRGPSRSPPTCATRSSRPRTRTWASPCSTANWLRGRPQEDPGGVQKIMDQPRG